MIATAARQIVALSKLRIVAMLVFTAACGMWKAAEGVPDAVALTAVLVGGALAAAGSNAINQGFDSDIDAIMLRTRTRVVPSNQVSREVAFALGTGMVLAAVLILGLMANWLSALLTLAAAVVYVFVYTIALKRTSWNNIVIGGAAGAFPPLIGAAAVSGSVDAVGLYMFAFVFFWTPPHFWTLSVLLRDEYSAAGIPMLASVAGRRDTAAQVLLYILLLGALAWLPYVAGFGGIAFALTGTALAGYWFWRSRALLHEASRGEVFAVYRLSLAFLAVTFLVIALEPQLPWY